MGIWRRLYGFQTLDRIDPGITLGNMKIPAIYKADKIEKNGRIQNRAVILSGFIPNVPSEFIMLRAFSLLA